MIGQFTPNALRRLQPRVRRWGVLAMGMPVLFAVAIALAQEPKVPDGWRFELPPGDAEAGEQAFAKMQCYTCHNVPGKQFVDPSQRPGDIGPDLTAAYAKLPREYLAESIINPNRVHAHGTFKLRYRASDGSTRMGDYSESMTVRELLDLVEFLQARR
ncbi:MAG TPA: c-type cytochrome [Alphaproteobacteria bacterium]|nr:c-type cytochrome [Alphaproteobacteria bacterium]